MLNLKAGNEKFECRDFCGACCIAPSISTALPGMPDGKPAGAPCVNLKEDYSCRVYDIRPPVCMGYRPSADCGESREEALQNLEYLEIKTRP